MKSNEPDLLKVHEEMPSIGPAENVIVESLISELRDLIDRLKSVNETAASEGDLYRKGKIPMPVVSALDKLRQQKTKIKDIEGVNMYNQTEPMDLTPMEKFVKYAEKRTSEALARTDEVQENFKGVLSYFGEDPAMTSTDFFGTMNKFVSAFDNALEVVKRLEAQKLAEEKKAAAQRAKEAKKANATKNVEKSRQQSDLVPEKGKLDLSKERKQYADPFAGPEVEEGKASVHVETNVLPMQRKRFADPFAGPCSPEKICGLQQSSWADDVSNTVSLVNKTVGFFPATSPGRPQSPGKQLEEPPRSARLDRYEQKTSTNARVSDESKFDEGKVLMAKMESPASPIARGRVSLAQAAAAAAKKIQHLQLPDFGCNPQTYTPEDELHLKTESEKTELVDPRAALMTMLKNRAPPIDDSIGKTEQLAGVTEDVHENDKHPVDPRSALMNMLKKRAPFVAGEAEETKDYAANPRAALMAMSKNRAPPADIEPELSVTDEKETDEEGEVKNADPRAALMSMLKNRVLPVEQNFGQSAVEKDDCDGEEEKNLATPAELIEVVQDSPTGETRYDTQDTLDPRAALITMFKNRTPPIVGDSIASVTNVKNEDKEQLDPRAALMTMLTPPVKKEPEIVQQQRLPEEINRSGREDSSLSADEDSAAKNEDKPAGRVDPKSARMTTLQNCAAEEKRDDAKVESVTMTGVPEERSLVEESKPKSSVPIGIAAIAAAAARQKMLKKQDAPRGVTSTSPVACKVETLEQNYSSDSVVEEWIVKTDEELSTKDGRVPEENVDSGIVERLEEGKEVVAMTVTSGTEIDNKIANNASEEAAETKNVIASEPTTSVPIDLAASGDAISEHSNEPLTEEVVGEARFGGRKELHGSCEDKIGNGDVEKVDDDKQESDAAEKEIPNVETPSTEATKSDLNCSTAGETGDEAASSKNAIQEEQSKTTNPTNLQDMSIEEMEVELKNTALSPDDRKRLKNRLKKKRQKERKKQSS